MKSKAEGNHFLTPAYNNKVEVSDSCKRERYLYLQKQVKAFKEHPKESGEMKVSEEYVTHAPDLNHGLIVVGLYQALQKVIVNIIKLI